MDLASIDRSMPSRNWSGGVAGYLFNTISNVLLFIAMCSPDCRSLFVRLVAVFNSGEAK